MELSIKKRLLGIAGAVALFGAASGFVGCTVLVKADRSKVPDDLYQPSPGTGGSAGATGGAGGSDVDAAGDAANAADAASDVASEGGNVGDAAEAGGPDALDAVSLPDANPG